MPVPNLQIAKRRLNFYYILDVSGSMKGNGRIQALNQSVRQSIPKMVEAAQSSPNAELMIHAITFGSTANWHVYPGIPIESFVWQDVSADGATSMGSAVGKVCDDLESNMPSRSLPPVLVLVSDGHPTDDFDQSLARLAQSPWGRKAVRIAIGMGPRHEIDWGTMERFMFDMDLQPLHAANSADLADYIRWASTVAVAASSAGSSTGDDGSPIHMSAPPIPPTVIDYGDVF
jgi:uncharacterized protein YegL